MDAVRGVTDFMFPGVACCGALRSKPTERKGVWGELFMYNAGLGYAAFRYGEISASTVLVCIGGLSDGLLSAQYLKRLSKALEPLGVTIVQPVLRSSYKGWGIGRLEEDAEDIETLLEYLVGAGASNVLLLGHSVGCRSVVAYLADGKHVPRVRAAILQGPISDREAMPMRLMGRHHHEEDMVPLTTQEARVASASASAFRGFRERATQMIREGKGDEVMPREAAKLLKGDALTAYRFHSLTDRMGGDDFFSSDLTPAELGTHLCHVSVPALVVFSEEDEYLPESVDLGGLADRIREAMPTDAVGSVDTMLIADGDNDLSTPNSDGKFIEGVVDFVRQLPKRKRLFWERGAAQHIRSLMVQAKAGRPILVALAGMSAVGKSTSAAALRKMLGSEHCLVVSLQGFIQPLEELKKRRNSSEWIWRRGSMDTYNPVAIRTALIEMKDDARGPNEVPLPGIDRKSGEPVPKALKFIRRHHTVVIVEGDYLLSDRYGWQDIPGMFDYRIFLDSSVDACMKRIKELGSDALWRPAGLELPEDVEKRIDQVDRMHACVVKLSAVTGVGAHLAIYNGFDDGAEDEERMRRAAEKIEAVWRGNETRMKLGKKSRRRSKGNTRKL